MASESLLESIAQHETSLMGDLDSTREEARQIVEAAHADSAVVLQNTNTQLEAQIAELRRNAAREREEVKTSIEEAAASNVEKIRTESAERKADVRKELVDRILPNTRH